MKKFGIFISKNKAAILIISVLLLLPSVFGIIMTRINYDILSYLPNNLDTVKGQRILDETFHNAAMSMLIIEDMQPKDIVKVKDNISKVDGVEKVIWVNDLLDTSIPKEMLPDDVKNMFYNKNSTLLFIKYKENSSSESTMNAIGDIRRVTNKQSFLSGLSAIVRDTKDLADKETPLYTLIAVVLCLIVLSLSLESYAVPFIFLFSIGLAVIYNLGTNIFLGEISYITKALVAVLQLGVTMDYSIFLLHRYDEEKQKTKDRNAAMAEAIVATFTSILGSSLTTIAGFLALCTMNLGIGKDIGLVMAKGVLIGVIVTVTALPAMILVFDKIIHKYQHKVFLPKFSRTASFVTKHYKVLAVIFLIAFIPSIYSKVNTNVYYNLDESLPKDLPSVIATNKLKNEYKMTTTHMIILSDEIPSFKIDEMVDKIKNVDGIENVLSYDSIVGPMIPESFLPLDLTNEIKKDGYKLIIANSKYKAATNEENAQIDSLNSIVKTYDRNAMVAGEGSLTKDLIKIADKDFMTSSFFSIAAIFAIILFVFSSLTIPIILVLCIELAIFINMGIPFYTGQTIPFIASIVIGCIQLGATVDYAILLTSRFREEIRNGLDKFEAMRISIQGSARSIVTSALSFFAATIGVGIIAKMEMIKTLCEMLAMGALISMIVIILILPAVLLASERLVVATSRHWDKKSVLKLESTLEEE